MKLTKSKLKQLIIKETVDLRDMRYRAAEVFKQLQRENEKNPAGLADDIMDLLQYLGVEGEEAQLLQTIIDWGWEPSEPAVENKPDLEPTQKRQNRRELELDTRSYKDVPADDKDISDRFRALELDENKKPKIRLLIKKHKSCD